MTKIILTDNNADELTTQLNNIFRDTTFEMEEKIGSGQSTLMNLRGLLVYRDKTDDFKDCIALAYLVRGSRERLILAISSRVKVTIEFDSDGFVVTHRGVAFAERRFTKQPFARS